MKTILQSTIGQLELGAIQHSGSIAFIPLSRNVLDGGPDYLTLSQALLTGCLTVQELSDAGSVPELLVLNSCDKCVLLIDGEELIGAKQNRSVNASILLAPHSETKIPVSCTEHGRWAQSEDGLRFRASDNIMNLRVRQTKSVHTRMSLAESQTYSSPRAQHAVWDGIDKLSFETNSPSPTSAMRDVYEAQRERMQGVVADLPSVGNQCGSIFFVNGQVAGCEILSLSGAYESLHEKLLRSYALDAGRENAHHSPPPSPEDAGRFLTAISNSETSKYESVGLGYDYRITGASLVGSALCLDDSLIHLASFASHMPDQATEVRGRMAGYQARRARRRL